MNVSYFSIGGLSCKVTSKLNFDIPKHIEAFTIIGTPDIIDINICIDEYTSNTMTDHPVIKFGKLIYKNENEMCVYKDDSHYLFIMPYEDECYVRVIIVDTLINTVYMYYDNTNYLLKSSTHFLDSSAFMLSYILLLIHNYNGFLLHSGAVRYGEGGFLYYGISGAGKSTLSEIFSQRYDVFTDETVIIRCIKGSYFMYGSHWKGSGHEIYMNSNCMIKNTVSIYHSEVNILTKLDDKMALDLLLQQSFPMFWDHKLIVLLISKLFDFVKQQSNYSLGFYPNDDVIGFLQDRRIINQ